MNMADRFFTPGQFAGKFNQEALLAEEVYRRILGNGFKEYAYAEFDAAFLTDKKEKAEAFGVFLARVYDAKVTGVKEENGLWELSAGFPRFPLNQENLLCWATDLLLKGYQFDCRLDGYGTFANASNDEFPDEDGSRLPWYFEEALKAYNNANYSASIIYFTSAIRIFPENPNAWYSRGTAKDGIYLQLAARRDYDKAIELAPVFVEAYINRAINKDLTEEYDAALADFDKAIELDGDNATAYFNRGNTLHNMGNTTGACANWRKAKELGAAYADEQLQLHCK